MELSSSPLQKRQRNIWSDYGRLQESSWRHGLHVHCRHRPMFLFKTWMKTLDWTRQCFSTKHIVCFPTEHYKNSLIWKVLINEISIFLWKTLYETLSHSSQCFISCFDQKHRPIGGVQYLWIKSSADGNTNNNVFPHDARASNIFASSLPVDNHVFWAGKRAKGHIIFC